MHLPKDSTAAPGRSSQSIATTLPAAPLISLICVVLGGLAANELIPLETYYVPGALAPAAITLAVVLLVGPLFSGDRSPTSLFQAENILSLGLVYWLLVDFIFGGPSLHRLPRSAIVESFLAIETFAAAIWLGSLMAAHFRPRLNIAMIQRQLQTDISADFLFYSAVACGILGLSRYVVGCAFSFGCLADSFYSTRFAVPWIGKNAFGHFDTLFYYFRYFGYVVLPLSVALISVERRFSPRALFTLLLAAICLLFLARGGGRKEIGTAVGAAILAWLLLRDRLQIKHMLTVAAAVAGLVLIMQAMLISRDVGFGKVLDGSVSIFRSPTQLGQVDKNLLNLAHVIDLVPERVPFAGLPGAMHELFLWIPMITLPSKGLDLAYELGWQRGPGWSWTASAVGDLYLIGGFPLIIVGGLLFGSAARMVNRLVAAPVTVRKRVLYGLAVMTLFMSLRAIHEYGVTGMTVVALGSMLYVKANWPRSQTRVR